MFDTSGHKSFIIKKIDFLKVLDQYGLNNLRPNRAKDAFLKNKISNVFQLIFYAL